MGEPFRTTRAVTIEWGDCDPAGIVFYPRYFAMFDASSWALIAAALGCGERAIGPRFGIVGFPMVDTRAEFHAPTRFGDRVTIASQVDGIKRSSFTVSHRLSRADGTLAVSAWETRVWAAAHPDDPARIAAVPVPDAVRSALLDPPAKEATP